MNEVCSGIDASKQKLYKNRIYGLVSLKLLGNIRILFFSSSVNPCSPSDIFPLSFPSSLLRYGGNLSLQSAMSVRFNSNGTQLLALRRRLPPVLYDIHCRLPVFQFDNQGYFNSCTMKSCCFAGDRDQVISG